MDFIPLFFPVAFYWSVVVKSWVSVGMGDPSCFEIGIFFTSYWGDSVCVDASEEISKLVVSLMSNHRYRILSNYLMRVRRNNYLLHDIQLP